MRGVRATGRIAAAVCLVLALVACSESNDPEVADDTAASVTTPDSVEDTVATVTTEPTTTGAEDSTPNTTTTAISAATTTTEASADTTIPTNLRDIRGDLGIGTVVLDPTTETGSHPTLSWQPVEGAASYWLVLNDADGRPYWAWTGTDTNVRVGGGDSPDTNQTAALHEEMTWSVAAFDGEGSLVALSDPASVAP